MPPAAPPPTSEVFESTESEPAPNTAIPSSCRSVVPRGEPNPRQAELLDLDASRLAVCTSPQQGKTQAAAKALHLALAQPGALVLIFGPVGPQAGELLGRIRQFAHRLDLPTKADRNHTRSLVLPNGSRFIALPDVPTSARGYASVALILIDEDAFVHDQIFQAITPMLAVSNGALWIFATPNGQTGRFHEICTASDLAWTRFFSPSGECPRINLLHPESLPLGATLFDLPARLKRRPARHAYALQDAGHGRQPPHRAHAPLQRRSARLLPPGHPTSGYTTSDLKDSYKGIPRPDLLTRLRSAFDLKLIHLPIAGPGFAALEQELIHCRADGHQREHDDLVFALATWFVVQKRKEVLMPKR